MVGERKSLLTNFDNHENASRVTEALRLSFDVINSALISEEPRICVDATYQRNEWAKFLIFQINGKGMQTKGSKSKYIYSTMFEGEFPKKRRVK